MKQDIIWKHRNFWKALLALAKWLPAPEDNSEITEDDIINIAKQEYCKNFEDIKKSITVGRIINLISKKTWNIISNETEKSILYIYGRFILGAPITTKERDYLLWFFRDEKSQKIAQDILSKLKLLQWDENEWVMNYFLKNDDWKLDFTRFLEFIIRDLEEYKLIIPEGEDIKILKNWNYTKEILFFEYKINWKTQICAVSNWRKIHFLDKDLESVKLLDNWLIFWVENFPSGMEWIPDRKKWYLYKFYDKKWFSEVHVMIGIVDLDIVESLSSELNTTFKTQNEEWKKWLLEMTKENKDEKVWDFKELLSNRNDDILVNNNWFITAVYKDIFKPEYNIYETLIKQSNWPNLLKQIKISKSKEDFEIEDLWDNLVLIRTDDWDSLLKFNEKESRLEVIDSALVNMSPINVNKFLEWKPTEIERENWDSWIYVFDKKTWIVTMLIKETNFTHRIEGDLIKSKLGKKYYIHFWKDWVLYRLKKWYKYDSYEWGISKWFFWSNIYINNWLEESIKECIEPVNASELPVDLK